MTFGKTPWFNGSKRKLGLAAALVSTLGLMTALAVAQEHGQEHGEGHAAPPGAGHGLTDPHATAPHGPMAAPLEENHAEHGEHGEHAEHGAGHHGPEAINWIDLGDKKRPAYIALIVNFGLLAGLYYTLGKKPVTEALKQRRVTIGKDIEDAQKMLAEAKERAKKYQADLKNGEADAETARAALVSSGKGEVERLLRDAQEKAERMKRDADRLVQQERKQLQQDLIAETVEVAIAEAAQMLERSVTPADHARLADDLLEELAKRPAAAKSASGGMS